jgi:hypothetical protein
MARYREACADVAARGYEGFALSLRRPLCASAESRLECRLGRSADGAKQREGTGYVQDLPAMTGEPLA